MSSEPLNMFVIQIHSTKCFTECFTVNVPNLFYTLWFVFTAFLVHMHAARKTKIDSVLTALYICVVAFVLSFVHSHVLYVKTDLDGKWIMLWMFASFTICWTLSNLIGDAGMESSSSVLYTKARPLLVMPKRGAVDRDQRPVHERPYHDAIKKVRQVSMPRGRGRSAQIAPIFSRLRLVWFIFILGIMLVLKHGLEVDMDSVVMICWIAFAIMTTMIERYLGLKRWLVTTYRRFKPTHDARSPWRVVNERLPSPDFTPLLVFVNSSSGGNLGKVLLEHVEELNLNELQVWNMSWGDPIYAFRPFDDCLRAGRKIRVLVCGGDGTVAWVLGDTGIGALPQDFRKLVAVAILPLGTGNDLARALGWGGGYSGAKGELKRILGELLRAHEVLLDRWDVTVKTPKRKRARSRLSSFGIRRRGPQSGKSGGKGNQASFSTKTHIMNNYIGFGCGAQVSLNFHTRRERYKWLFQSQIFNKFIYAIIGGTQVIQHFFKRFLSSPKELFPRSIALKCDGRRVNLDAYEDNRPKYTLTSYYGGGMNVWRQAMEVTPDSPALRPRIPSEDYMSTKLDSMMLESKNKSSSSSNSSTGMTTPPRNFRGSSQFRRYRTKACQSFNDGLLEVVGVRMTNLAVGQIGLPTGERIAQCAEIDIEILKNVAMQIDGEPQMLKSGAHIELRCNQQVWMFQRSEVMSSTNAGVLQSILQWGETRGILSSDQSNRLNKELTRRMFEATKDVL